MGLGVSGMSSLVQAPSTPQAAAHEAGGTWGVIHGGFGGGPPSQHHGVWVKRG